MVKTVRELRRRLRKELPIGAVRQHPDNERSAVSPMFVIERLNDCFGEDGWTADYKVIENHSNSKMIVVECLLRCWFPWWDGQKTEKSDITRRAFGGNNNDDRGDAYKGACTDALTKAASHLGIAHQVYKGLYDLRPQAVVEPEPKRDGRTLNQAQVRNFWAAVRESGISQEQVDRFLSDHNVASVNDIPKIGYEKAMEWARQKAEAA